MEMVQPTVLTRESSNEERESALWQIYAQVLERQPYQFERRELAKFEKDFLKGKMGVRRFLKELGHSRLYLDTFYYSTSNMKFLETCFKHFLGRSIRNAEELRIYCSSLCKSGVHQLILDILDSDEYRKVFGCFTVPYYREERCHETPNEYLENTVVQHEHFGQRGWSLPTLYWHQLGMNCDGGVCLYIDDEPSVKPQYAVDGFVNTPKEPRDELQEELMELLGAL
ncbi:MAG: phycobilisome rod-core linker polypeptide [Leptolyngbyaceae bacterium]|nr:phycobilisome rod-core linker polypeptide [Leptolyngbyaceae bacterium]